MTNSRCPLLGLAALVSCLIAIAARGQDSLPIRVPEGDRVVHFQKDIVPILQSNCLACHNSSEAEGDLVLESVEAMQRGGLSGPAVVEGKSEESPLFQAAAQSGEIMMPPFGNVVGAKDLTPEQLGLLKLWIDQGAPSDGGEPGDEVTSRSPLEWQQLDADVDPVYAVAVTRQGRYVAAGWGNRLFVYQVATQRLVTELVDPALGEYLVSTTPNQASAATAHLDLIHALAMSPDGRRIASGGFRTVKIWRRESPDVAERRLDGLPPEPVEMSDASGQLSLRVSGGLVEIVKPDSGEVVRNLDLGRTVRAAAMSPDGTRVVASGPGGPAKLWNAESGESVADLHGSLHLRDRVAGADQLVRVRERQRDNAQKDLEAAAKRKQEAQEQIKQAESEVEAAQTALPEKQKLDEEKSLAKAVAAEHFAAIKEGTDGAEEAKEALKKASEEADAAAKERETAERNLEAARQAVERNRPAAYRATEDAEQAEADLEQAKQTVDEATKQRDAVQQELAENEADLRAVAFSPDSKEVAIVDASGAVYTFASVDGSALEEMAVGGSDPLGLEYIGVHRVQVRTADAIYEVDTLPRWELERTVGSLEDPQILADRVTALDFSPDGRQLAAGGGEPSRSGQIKIFDVGTGSVLQEFAEPHSDTVFSLAFSPDGKRLASGGADRFAKLFDVAGGTLEKTLEGHTGHVLAVAWHADGRTLATASADNSIKFWDTRSGEQQKAVDGFDTPLHAITFLGTDDLCIVAGGKNLVTSRKTDGSAGPSYGGATDVVHAVDASGDGGLIVAGGQDGHVRVWQREGKELATFTPPGP